MDPLKSLVRKKRLFTSFLKYDLLNQAAAEANLYSEEQGRELEELARDNPVAAVERLLELIRLHSTYEAFIQALERSIEIGHSQHSTVVDAQAHEQLINEIVGSEEKKPKGLILKRSIDIGHSQRRTVVDAPAHEQPINENAGEKKPKGFKGIKVHNLFKSKEKKSKESESKQHFLDKNMVMVFPQEPRKYAPRQKTEFQKSEESEMDQDDDPLMDASDLLDSTHSGHHPIPEDTVSAIYDSKGICKRISGTIHGEQMRQDSHYNHGGQPVPKYSQSLCDPSELSRLPDTINEQDPRNRRRRVTVSSVSGSEYKRRSLPRPPSFGKNQGSHPGASYTANNQAVLLKEWGSTVNVTHIHTEPKLTRAASTTSMNYAMNETSVRIENMQKDIEFQKLKIESLTDKVNQVNVVATDVKHIQKDQDVSSTNQAKLQEKIVSMGERLTALEASGNKEEVVRKENLMGLQTKYQELERENEKIKEREVKLQAKVQSYEKRQQELHEELTTLRRNEVKSLARTEEQIKLSRALQNKMDAYVEEQAILRDLVAGLQEKLKGSHLEPQSQAKHEKSVTDIKLDQVNLDTRVEEQKVILENTQSDVKELHGKMQASEAKHQNSREEIEELKRTNALLHSDTKVAQTTLAQYDSLWKGMKEEIDQISRQCATMQAETSRREEDRYVSQEKSLLTDEQKREIDDLEKRLEKQIAQSQERIEQMGKRQKTMDEEIQDNIRSIEQIHQKLCGNGDGPTEWDKLHKKMEDAGREMGKINEITEKLKTMEELNRATEQDVNKLRRQVEEQKDAVEKIIQKDQDEKSAEDDQATTDHTYSASLENLKQQVTHMQTSWEKRFEEFERKVRSDGEWKEIIDEEVERETEKLRAMMNEGFEDLKRKQALQRKQPPP